MPEAPPGSIPESAYRDEVVHVQKTSRAEQEMIERLQAAASAADSIGKVEAPGTIPESAYKDEVVHVQKTSRAEQEMIKRLEEAAASKVDKEPERKLDLPLSRSENEGLVASPRSSIRQVGNSSSSPRRSVRVISTSAPSSPRHAAPAPVSPEIKELVSRLEREGTHFENVVSRRKTLPPGSLASSGDRPKEIVSHVNNEERTLIERLEDQQSRFDSLPPTTSTPASSLSMSSLEPWEIERELVGNPKLQRTLIQSLFFHYNSDVTQLIHGVARELGADVEQQGRGSILVTDPKVAKGCPALSQKSEKKILRAHKESIAANNHNSRLDRLRIAYSRVKPTSGSVTAYDIATNLSADVTSRRLTATAFGATPLFCKQLIALLKSLGHEALTVADFQRYAESLM